ncbi:hypothetical protein EAF04_002949 [Stromatinia cepivora]|nr:hypothetical protein EAF04_002949 [Stromatinia cepivora]
MTGSQQFLCRFDIEAKSSQCCTHIDPIMFPGQNFEPLSFLVKCIVPGKLDFPARKDDNGATFETQSKGGLSKGSLDEILVTKVRILPRAEHREGDTTLAA